MSPLDAILYHLGQLGLFGNGGQPGSQVSPLQQIYSQLFGSRPNPIGSWMQPQPSVGTSPLGPPQAGSNPPAMGAPAGSPFGPPQAGSNPPAMGVPSSQPSPTNSELPDHLGPWAAVAPGHMFT
jgi:hypothetical protein